MTGRLAAGHRLLMVLHGRKILRWPVVVMCLVSANAFSSITTSHRTQSHASSASRARLGTEKLRPHALRAKDGDKEERPPGFGEGCLEPKDQAGLAFLAVLSGWHFFIGPTVREAVLAARAAAEAAA